MSPSKERLCRRQKTCLILSILILLLGSLQFCLEILFWLWWFHNPCHNLKHIVVGIYLMIAGISGCVAYSAPKNPRNPLKTSQNSRSRESIVLFLLFSSISTIVVIVDGTQLNCYSTLDVQNGDGYRLHDRLALTEISCLQLAHLLCALSVGLSCPDLWSSISKWFNKPDKQLNNSTKKKSSKQALHLPEARTHVQEAPGTGDRITVISLPETDGIVYAVPEEQYVIRRGEATYMAPIGNTHLTGFFPTYRSQTE